MPAPNPGMLMNVASSSIPMTQNPQAGQKLANAVGKVIGNACGDFVQRVFMEPGVPCVVTPPAMVGNVTGVGRLGGACPSASELKVSAMSVISSSGLSKHGQDIFAETISSLTGKGLEEFMKLAQVLPGTPITGSITAAPVKLTVPVQAVKSQLDMMVLPKTPGAGAVPSVSELPPDFPKIVVKVVSYALEQMAQMVMVAPGIPVAPSQTAGPGKLM